MSRTLLSSRLKELTERGIVTKTTVENSPYAEYQLTPAGESLSSVVFGMADWGQEWLQIEPALENLDADHLIDIARSRLTRDLSEAECQAYLHVDSCTDF